MTTTEAKQFLNKHCIFKLKTGKEVFGVIWEVFSGNKTSYFFASAREHEILKQTNADNEELLFKMGQPIKLEDIINAKSLVS
ncbi:MAG: hypothetical protein HND27_07425 [Bacteroidetes bacterium]|nr:hypothetical protein [Bacteroidota bacterium]MBV6461802.1 hypothetical protein [Flavobacteriales bacterium]WKZ75916.1 MAG: hypothetical protein QY303_03280 [Vicingaceae bacterium]MCL4816704.1 hypothetical protein [Flavobacteriales bacterium]NOG95594.1 hypothetical protein [Bacteroidota bacterium]